MNKKILLILFISAAAVAMILLSKSNLPDSMPNFYHFDYKNYKSFEAPKEIKDQADEKLSKIKVASLYENITDGPSVIPERSLDETIKILKETDTDFVFRGFFRWWAPDIDNPGNMSEQLCEEAKKAGINPDDISSLIEKSGYYYDKYYENLSVIKKEIPELIFTGSIAAQRLNRVEHNPLTDEIISMNDTWNMALDPKKWDIKMNDKSISKKEFQAWFAGIHQWQFGGGYDPTKVEAYFPDITNPDFQKLMLSWAKKQIDLGVDAIWIDGLHGQSLILYIATKDPNHPSIKESSAAASMIVDEIHKYGLSKEKYIYVGSWAGIFPAEGLPDPTPKFDFVTITPTEKEIEAKKLDQERWGKELANARKLYGNIPIFAFIDWSFDTSPMVSFSQKLDSGEQREVLRLFDESLGKMGVNFVYPIHGGYMGSGEITKRISFGQSKIFDGLAPEFDIYGTIKELANKKASN